MDLFKRTTINILGRKSSYLNEVEQIRKGILPKRSYKEMIARIRGKLCDESK